MSAAPITATATLVSSSNPNDAMAELRRFGLAMPARIEQPNPLTLLVHCGSRLRLRLLGVWAGGRHLPMKLRFDAEPAPHGTLVRLTMTSDHGWYLAQTPLAEAAYAARFTDLLKVIEAEGFTRTN